MCEYCAKEYDNKQFKTKSDFEIEIDTDGLNIYFNQGNMYENYSDSTIIPINFCPMCGRKLNEGDDE